MSLSSPQRLPGALPFLCFALFAIVWSIDLVTPQLLIVAILLNAPIALSGLALRDPWTMGFVVGAEIANAVAGYANGAQSGFQWNAIAVADRALLAASFLLVGYLSVKATQYAREAGVSAGRMRQVELERALRGASERMRESLNVELVQRAMLRESLQLLDASQAVLVVRDTQGELPLVFTYRLDRDVTIERRGLSTELASLCARVSESAEGPIRTFSSDDALGRLTLEAFGARAGLAARIGTPGGVDSVLIETVEGDASFVSDASQALAAFAEQAEIALDQARLFARLGERNAEIEHQASELSHRDAVIRDIVYALAHDLRTPLAAADVTMKQALAAAYGPLPERYRAILNTAIASNDEQRRMVETLLLVARYEAGEASTLHELVSCCEALERATEELRPIADLNGVALTLAAPLASLQVFGDASEIRRAVINLVANAVAATPKGGAVTVRGVRDGDIVVLAVEDDGYGVPPERRGALFERFGGTHAGAGTGLGLYIVARIAQKHGGSVRYAPREPRGSIFTVVLPAADTA